MSTDYEDEEEVMMDEEEYEVDYIYKHRGSLERNNIEYFVHWKGYPDSDNSWVSSEQMACPELIGEYFDRLEAKKAKKKMNHGGSKQMGSRAPSVQSEGARTSSVPPVLQRDTARGTSSAQKEREKSTTPAVPKEAVRRSSVTPQKVPPMRLHLPTTSKAPLPYPEPEHPPLKLKRKSSVPPVLQRDTARGTSSAQKEREKSTTPAVPTEAVRRSSVTRTKQTEPETADAAQKVPPIRLHLPTTSKAPRSAPESEHLPLKLKISRSSASAETKEPTVLAEESPTRRKRAQRAEVDQLEEVVEPQISQLRISEDSSSLGTSVQKKAMKLPKVPPLPNQKKTSMVEKRRSSTSVQEEPATTTSRQEAAPSSSGTVTEEPGANPSLREETPASQEIEKTAIPDVMPTPAPEVGRPLEEERMDTDELPETSVGPTPASDTTPAEVVEESGGSKDSELDEDAEASIERQEESESGDDYSDSDSSESEAEENDDDISDVEDFQKQNGAETSVRDDKKKNGYEKGMKGETLISFVKKGDLISGLVKFEGSNKLEIIPYAQLRILDPALVARYHVKMLLARSSSDDPPKEGLIKDLKTREIDSSF